MSLHKNTVLVEPNWRQRLPTKRRIQPGSTHLDYLLGKVQARVGGVGLDRGEFIKFLIRESKEKTMLLCSTRSNASFA